MKLEKQQEKPQIPRRIPVKYLFMVWQWPLLVSTGLRNWNKNTVPVGRSLMRLPTPVKVLTEMECWGLFPEPEDLLVPPIGIGFLVCIFLGNECFMTLALQTNHEGIYRGEWEKRGRECCLHVKLYWFWLYSSDGGTYISDPSIDLSCHQVHTEDL